MQRKPRRHARTTDIVLLSGWLFADLLLALAVIFLASSNTSAFRLAPTPTSTATPTTIPSPSPTAPPTPTPTPPPRLELSFHTVTLTIDSNALLNDSQDTINSLKQQIRQQQFLQRRTAGLVIAYDGALTADAIPQSQLVARKVMDVLRSLGNEHFAFTNTSYYKPLYNLGDSQDAIEIDIFLFT